METKRMKFKILLVALFTFAMGTMANAATFTAIASGNWSSSTTWSGGVAPGTNITIDDIEIPNGITVTLDQNVEFNGLLSTMEVMGTLNSTTNSTLTMTGGTITGSGTIDIDALVIGNFGGSSFTGDIMVKTFTNAGATLVFTTLIDVTDELFLEAGSLTLDAGANLQLSQSATIRIDDGALIGNGGLFSTDNDYNIRYVGTSKNTGMELEGNSEVHVEVDLDNNTEVLTLSGDLNLTGNIDHKAGMFDISGQTLTLNGDYMSATGVMIMSDNSSAISLRTNGNVTGALMFDASNNSIGTFELDLASTGKVVVSTDLEVANELIIKNGDFQVDNAAKLSLGVDANIMIDNGTMIMTNSSFEGSTNYDVTYVGASKNAGLELNGSGLDNLTIDLDNNTATLILKSNAKVNGNLDLKAGILVMNNNDLELAGDFTRVNDAKIKGSAGSSIMVNAASKFTNKLSFTTDGEMLDGLTVNIGDGTDLEVESDLMVKTITFTNGSIMLEDNMITIDNGGSVTGANTSRYIKIDGEGMVKMMVGTNGYTSFPVGTMTDYSPANLQLNSGSASNFTVHVAKGVWTAGTTGTDLALSESLVDRTWDIKSDAGANVDLDMKLEWMSSAEVNGFDRSKAYISHYTNGEWDVNATANATSTASGTYEISRKNITSLSPFAVSDNNGLTTGVTPVEVAINRVYPNPVTNKLNCEFSANEATTINVVDVSGKLVYTENIEAANNNMVHEIDFSSMPSGVYFVKISAENTQVVQKVIK